MQGNECGVLLSASDLLRPAGCAPRETSTGAVRGRGTAPGEDSEAAELVQRHGDAHGTRAWGAGASVGRGRRRGGRFAGIARRRERSS